MMNSEPIIPSSYQASCASNEQESVYLKRARPLGWAQFGLAFLSFGAAIAIVGCEAVPLQHYLKTSAFENVWLSLWPMNFDLRPSTALLSCGGVIALQNLIYIVVSLLPSPHSRIRLLSLLAAATALSGFITALVGVVFALYLPSSSYPSGFAHNETLHSWTCKWDIISHSTSNDTMTQAPPTHFARDCTETRAAFVLLGLLIGLEIIMGGVASVGLWLERGVARHRRNDRLELEKIEIAVKNSGP